MMPDETVTPGPGNPLFYALRYAALGWHVFPAWWAENGKCGCGNSECKSPGKHPHSQVRRGQQDSTTDRDTIQRWWSIEPRCNVAIFLLPSNLVAIDIDPRNGGMDTIADIEARYGPLQSDVLQLTGGDGEHRLFYASTEVLNSLPGKLGPGIDIKVNGYIIVEPSMHISGKRYAWEASSDPLHGAVPSPLPDWLRNLAVPAPASISQSASRTLTDEQLREIRSALAFIQSDDYHQWVNVGQALKPLGQIGFGLWDNWSQLSDKYEPKGMPEKWRSFRPGTFQVESIFHLAQQAGWLNPLSVEAQKEAEFLEMMRRAQVAAPQVQTFTPAAVAPRAIPVDILQTTVEWIERASGVLPTVATVQTVLAIAANACSRLYVTEFGDPAHLYLAINAQSLGELSWARIAAQRVFHEAGLRKLLREQRISSISSFYKAILRAPATLYVAHDWGIQVQLARRQPSGLIEHVMHLMATMFDADQVLIDNPDEAGIKSAGSTDDMPTIYAPGLSILAFVSREQLVGVFKSSEIGRGALEQMLFATADDILHVGEPSPESPPAQLLDRIRTIRRLPEGRQALDLGTIFNGNAELMPTQTVVKFAQPLTPYYEFLRHEVTSRRGLLFARSAEKLLRRLSLILAVWKSPIEPVVTADIMQWATLYVRDRLQDSMTAMGLLATEDGRVTAYQRVLEVIIEEGERGIPKSNIARNCRAFQNLSAEKRSELLALLIADGEIVEVIGKSGKGSRIVSRMFVQDAS